MMANREKYVVALKCPTCGRAGHADMSDAKAYKIEPGGYDTRVESLPHGFEVRGRDVVCSRCQVSALWLGPLNVRAIQPNSPN